MYGVNFKKLNYIFENIINNCGMTFEDMLFDDKLNNIVLDNSKINFRESYYNCNVDRNIIYFSLEKSKKISKHFLMSINGKYGEIFDYLMKKGLMTFNKNYDSSSLDFIDGKNCITIKPDNTIMDVYSICHEFMHYINSRHEVFTYTTSYFTEMFSSYYEIELTKFILDNYSQYKKDSLRAQRNNFVGLYKKNIVSKIYLELLKTKLDGENIHYDTINQVVDYMLRYCDKNQLSDCFCEFFNILEDDVVDNNLRYIRALALPSYLCDYVGKEQVNIINDNLHNYDIVHVLKSFDFDFNGDDISLNTYNEIEKSYKKIIKGLW